MDRFATLQIVFNLVFLANVFYLHRKVVALRRAQAGAATIYAPPRREPVATPSPSRRERRAAKRAAKEAAKLAARRSSRRGSLLTLGLAGDPDPGESSGTGETETVRIDGAAIRDDQLDDLIAQAEQTETTALFRAPAARAAAAGPREGAAGGVARATGSPGGSGLDRSSSRAAGTESSDRSRQRAADELRANIRRLQTRLETELQTPDRARAMGSSL